MPNLIDLVVKLADAFDRLQLRYALGGALATSYWATPRATQDVNCLIALPALKYQMFADELKAIGFLLRDSEDSFTPVTVPRIVELVRTQSFIECFFDTVRVELFLPIVALQEEILRRAIMMPLDSREIPITTAEDLVLLKLAFHRPKDLLDVRSILWAQRGRLDLDYLRHWSARSHEPDVQREMEQLIAEYSSDKTCDL